MGWFGPSKPETRSSLIEKAARARSKGQRKKARGLYERALALQPGDHEIMARLAPLLAAEGKRAQAWGTFVSAATGFYQKGFVDKAVGVYLQAVRYFAQETELWERLADLNLQRGRPADAIGVLLDGRRRFRRRAQLPQARSLLRQAFEIQPYRFDVTMDLGLVLWRCGEGQGALDLLEGLAAQVTGWQLRRVRWRLLGLHASMGAMWRWLRALVLGR